MRGPFLQRARTLLGRTRRCNHLGACGTRQSHCREAYAAHRRVHQHALPRPDLRHVSQRERRRHVRVRQRHGGVKVECSGLGYCQRRARDGMRRK